MNWKIKHGNILDIPADVLITSANVQLTMSGVVGSALLVKYGGSMQEELRQYLIDQNLSSVEPGTVVKTSGINTLYHFVLHAVAVDVFYETTHEILAETMRTALKICAEDPDVKTIVMTALATGFGRLSMLDFAPALKDVMINDYETIDTVTLCVKNKYDLEELKEALY